MSRLRATDHETGTDLPDDPSVARLDPELRRLLGKQWQERATAELRVASVFAVVARGLFEAGGAPEVLRIAARAVSDEVRHAELCRVLAERYLGSEVHWPPPGPVPMPELAKAPRPLRATLHTIAMGCVNETIASAWLESSLRDAESPLARVALRELIADDIHHARLGWAHLASTFVNAERRREIGEWLPTILHCAARPWMHKDRTEGSARASEAPDAAGDLREGCPAHGVPSRETTRRVVRETVKGVVLPGFDALGVPTAGGREWVERELG